MLIKIRLPKKMPEKIQFQEWCEWKKQLMKQTKKYFWQNAQRFFYTLHWSPFSEKKKNREKEVIWKAEKFIGK